MKIQGASRGATWRVIPSGLYSMARQHEVFKEIEASFGDSLEQDFARMEKITDTRKR